MKNILRFSAILTVLFFSSCVPPQQEPASEEDSGVENAPASYQEFYDGLSPYGHWIQRPGGEYIWIPEVGPDFVPYSTNGSWVWTDGYGWAWTSDYSWGWAPFHYGRWDFDDSYGWFWTPDLTWGPAWVVWRECPGYYGWAPLRPGISVDIALGGGYDPGDRWWTVCDGRYMGRREMRDHYEHGGQNLGRIRGGESRVIGNAPEVSGGRRGFVTGPAKQQVETITHTPVQAVKIVQSNKPGEAVSGNTWSVYRPQPQRVSGSQAQPAAHVSTPQTQPAQHTAPTQTQPARTPQTQAAPRSVTTPQDIRDLHQQARQSTGRTAPPQNFQPRQSAPPPRQQMAPRQSAPRQQSAPRSNPPSQGGGGRPK